ncbi:unnamed protein product [Amoebophrya sp. A120]|nr:unnamed protein product [Amoebophrya sp. A120]|eukprot:GSA120T00012437001.1
MLKSFRSNNKHLKAASAALLFAADHQPQLWTSAVTVQLAAQHKRVSKAKVQLRVQEKKQGCAGDTEKDTSDAASNATATAAPTNTTDTTTPTITTTADGQTDPPAETTAAPTIPQSVEVTQPQLDAEASLSPIAVKLQQGLQTVKDLQSGGSFLQTQENEHDDAEAARAALQTALYAAANDAKTELDKFLAEHDEANVLPETWAYAQKMVATLGPIVDAMKDGESPTMEDAKAAYVVLMAAQDLQLVQAFMTKANGVLADAMHVFGNDTMAELQELAGQMFLAYWTSGYTYTNSDGQEVVLPAGVEAVAALLKVEVATKIVDVFAERASFWMAMLDIGWYAENYPPVKAYLQAWNAAVSALEAEVHGDAPLTAMKNFATTIAAATFTFGDDMYKTVVLSRMKEVFETYDVQGLKDASSGDLSAIANILKKLAENDDDTGISTHLASMGLAGAAVFADLGSLRTALAEGGLDFDDYFSTNFAWAEKLTLEKNELISVGTLVSDIMTTLQNSDSNGQDAFLGAMSVAATAVHEEACKVVRAQGNMAIQIDCFIMKLCDFDECKSSSSSSFTELQLSAELDAVMVRTNLHQMNVQQQLLSV